MNKICCIPENVTYKLRMVAVDGKMTATEQQRLLWTENGCFEKKKDAGGKACFIAA
jgi:hypothetical protein